MNLTFSDFLTVAALFGAIQFLASKLLEHRLAQSIKHEYDRKLEEYRFDMRRREQAARVAKLLAMSYRDNVPTHEFNELAWELSLWLPAELVRELTRCLCRAEGSMNPKELLIAIRKQLHSKEDDLTAEQIVHRLDPRADILASTMKNPIAQKMSQP